MEDAIARLSQYVNSVCPVGAEAVLLVEPYLEPCRFGKRENLVEKGKRGGYVYFVLKGITRSFWMENGAEYSTSFAAEGALVYSMDELYSGQPSQEYVQAIEEVEALRLPVEVWQRVTSGNIEWCAYFLQLHQREYLRIHRTHKERLTLDAAARYRSFCAAFPEVCNRSPLVYIASYLGIAPATLSRIRAGRRK